jgi:hypothetical protein
MAASDQWTACFGSANAAQWFESSAQIVVGADFGWDFG